MKNFKKKKFKYFREKHFKMDTQPYKDFDEKINGLIDPLSGTEYVDGYFTFLNPKLNGYYQRINKKTGNIIFKGNLINGLLNGYGEIYNKDGQLRYEGELKDGVPHGDGTCYIEAKYVNESKNENKIENSIYEGEFKYGHFNGYGKFYISDHLLYEGEFRKSLFHGIGIIFIQDSDLRYLCEFIDGVSVNQDLDEIK